MCHMSGVTSYVSRVTCQVSAVSCRVSGVTCHYVFVLFSFQTKWLGKSVEGLLSMGPTLSSYICFTTASLIVKYLSHLLKAKVYMLKLTDS